jgi:hypothetical protein
MKSKEEIMILNPLSAYVFCLIPLYEEGTKCGVDYNMHGIIFKEAGRLPQIKKRLTICIFLHRCAGLRVDRGTLSANAKTKKDFWAQVRRRH